MYKYTLLSYYLGFSEDFVRERERRGLAIRLLAVARIVDPIEWALAGLVVMLFVDDFPSVLDRRGLLSSSCLESLGEECASG